jgi:hypothetical protein
VRREPEQRNHKTQNTHTSGARLYERATRSTQNSVVDTINPDCDGGYANVSISKTVQVLKRCLAVRYFVVRSYSQLISKVWGIVDTFSFEECTIGLCKGFYMNLIRNFLDVLLVSKTPDNDYLNLN